MAAQARAVGEAVAKAGAGQVRLALVQLPGMQHQGVPASSRARVSRARRIRLKGSTRRPQPQSGERGGPDQSTGGGSSQRPSASRWGRRGQAGSPITARGTRLES